MSQVRIATRRSALALWQANHVKSLLEKHHPGIAVELVPIVTRGDRILDRPLAKIGGKGLFLKELEQSLLAGETDLAVHSMKDMPVEMTPGLVLQVALPRANAHDAWLSREDETLHATPPGSRVGTSSLRRRCQLLAQRPDLEVVELRGNVDTRLRKLKEGDYDAIILAAAGLERLGLEDAITHELVMPEWVPAATQGTIGLQCRTEDDALKTLINPLGDDIAMAQSRAERAVVRKLQGSCQVPLAVYAEVLRGRIKLQALVGTPDGRRLLHAGSEGELCDAEAIGNGVAQELVSQGAMAIIRALS